MFIHDLLNDVQTKTGARCSVFGRKELIENTRKNVIWNSWAVVGYGDVVFIIFFIQSDVNVSFSAHSVDCIFENIGP